MTRSGSHQHAAAPISHLVEADLRRANGDLLGVVDELLIDLESGRIAYVVATDVRGQRLQLPWRAITVENGNFVCRGPVHG